MEHTSTSPPRFAAAIGARLSEANTSLRAASQRTNIPLTTLVRRLNGSPFDVVELAAFADMFGITVSQLTLEAETLPSSTDKAAS